MPSISLKAYVLSIYSYTLETQIAIHKGWETAGCLGKIVRAKFMKNQNLKSSPWPLDLRKTKPKQTNNNKKKLDLSENALPKRMLTPIYTKDQWVYL